MYENKTSEDTIQKEKEYTETSTTEAKDDVLVGSAAKQAVKERGEHTAALRQIQQDAQTVLHSKQIQTEVSRKQSSMLMEDGAKLHDDNQCIKGKGKGKWCVAKYGDPYSEFVLCI